MSPLKPIFHCDAKYLASEVGVGQCPRRQNFVLEIPTCWYILALPNAKICVTPDAKPKICVIPDANPRRQLVEYRLRWVPTQNAGVGQVHFMFIFVDFICIWYPTRAPFPVEYGLYTISKTYYDFVTAHLN